MPRYELNFIVRKMPRTDLVACLKRMAEGLFDNDAVLRKIEFLGTRQLPYRLKNPAAPGSKRAVQGNYFVYHLDVAPQVVVKLRDAQKYDTDLLKSRFLPIEEKLAQDYECTLEEELQPPAFRKSVQKLIEEGRTPKTVYDKGSQEF